jgi:hypothetical protein
MKLHARHVPAFDDRREGLAVLRDGGGLGRDRRA